MKYIGTSTKKLVSLAEAVNRCVDCDGGLFMPERIPLFPRAFYNNIGEMKLRDIAFVVASTFFSDDIPANILKNIVDESFSFDAPLIETQPGIYVLELFHGPTLTCKDYGARFMARLLQALDGKSHHPRHVLVSTTGNTGAAAANGLFKLDGISVSVLYPRGMLTRSQTRQLTALGENIHPIEVLGSVEDCKNLIHKALSDPCFSNMNLTGANSINIARLIPQISFALYAYGQLVAREVKDAHKAIYAIPTGNLSNVNAAAMARAMGCPMTKIIAATGADNQLESLMQGSQADHSAHPQRSFAPAIDMAFPSGWPRLLHLYNGNLEAMRRDISVSKAINNNIIASTILDVRQQSGYTIDPHTALAYHAALADKTEAPKVVFATGHPSKQLDVMTQITGSAHELPVQLMRFMTERRAPKQMAPTIPALKKYLSSIH